MILRLSMSYLKKSPAGSPGWHLETSDCTDRYASETSRMIAMIRSAYRIGWIC